MNPNAQEDMPWLIAWIIVTLVLVALADYQPGLAMTIALALLVATALVLQAKGYIA